MRIKLLSGLFDDMSDGLYLWLGWAIWPVGAQCTVDIHDGEDAPREGDRLTPQAARVAAAVPFLVMAIRNIQGGAPKREATLAVLL